MHTWNCFCFDLLFDEQRGTFCYAFTQPRSVIFIYGFFKIKNLARIIIGFTIDHQKNVSNKAEMVNLSIFLPAKTTYLSFNVENLKGFVKN